MFSKREFTFINIISLLATLGIAFGVAALIVVLSVFNGFNGLVTSILLDFDPHIKIEKAPRLDAVSIDSLTSTLRAQQDIVGLAPFIQRKAMMLAKEYNMFVWIKGIDTARFSSVSKVKDKIVLGNFSLREKNAIVLGITLADKLRVLVGDSVTIISPAGLENVLTQFVTPTVMRCRVTGIYQSDNKIYDGSFAFIRLENAKTLFRMDESITGYEVRLKNIEDSDGVKEVLQKVLHTNWNVVTWYDLHKDLYSVMKIERWSAFILLCVIVAVAVFNIFASLTMLVLEKKRDIGILRSMGAEPSDIQKIFLTDGIFIGLIGTTLGLLIGLVLCWAQIEFRLIRLDAAFIIPALPVEIRFADLFLVVISTLLLCMIAATYPAWKAKNVVPIQAIRWE